MTYQELARKLQAIEKSTGVYLHDPCVDAENVPTNSSDAVLFDAALCAAADRAHEAGLDIYELLKATN